MGLLNKIFEDNGVNNIYPIKIAGIPTEFNHRHNLSFHNWKNVKDATLLHIDAHADLSDDVNVNTRDSLEQYCSDFAIYQPICPAIHEGIVSDVYWVNPHLKNHPDENANKRWIQYIGSKEKELETKVKNNKIKWAGFNIPYGEGTPIKPNEINLGNENKPFILDIDLDAFCCQRSIFFMTKDAYKTSALSDYYKEKVDETIEVLKDLKKPDLITITSSQKGKNLDEIYLPLSTEKMLELNDYVIDKLEKIYKNQ